MLLDFVPEAVALGAALVDGMLLAFLIAIQNLPEGFNAFREIQKNSSIRKVKLLLAFTALALLGPLSAFFGATVLADQKAVLGVLMVFSSGGILFLTFQDIAPQARLEKHWAPTLGAVLGFALGLMGHMLSA